MHRTSNLCNSVSINTFSRLIPAMFMLPTFMPVLSHLDIRSFLFFFYLAEPFVFLLPFLYCVCPVLLYLSSDSLVYFGLSNAAV
jgi:hypothetical protein